MVIKCKPVYNFQSVEFEFEIPDDIKDIKVIDKFYDSMFKMYEECLHRLKEIAIEQPALAKPIPVKQEPKATPNQIKWLVSLGIEQNEAERMTKAEAGKKINELVNR